MKHLSFVIVLLISVGIVKSSAQGYYRVSARVGSGYSFGQFDLIQFTSAPIKEKYSGFGFYGGGSVEFAGKSPISKSRFQMDLNYNYNVLKNKDISLRLVVINLPLLYKFYVYPRLNFTIGAAFGINLVSKQAISNIASGNRYPNTDVRYLISNMKFFQPAAVLGISYYVSNRVYVDIRYHQYFGNRINEEVYSNTKVSLKYNTLQFGVGVSGLLSNKSGRYFPKQIN